MEIIGLTRILDSVPYLDLKERQILKERLIALETLEKGGSQKPLLNGGILQPQNTDILQAICDFMAFKGLEHPHMGALQRTTQYKAFCDKIPALNAYMAPYSRQERKTLLFIGVELLYKNLVEMGVVVTGRTLMSHIHRLPGCLNRAFPGYAKGGFLRLITRRRDVRPK